MTADQSHRDNKGLVKGEGVVVVEFIIAIRLSDRIGFVFLC